MVFEPETANSLVNLLSTELMALLWGLVIFVSFYMVYRTKLFGLMVIGGGAVPILIFHLYNIFGIWENRYWTAVLYSRVAQISLVVSILLSFWLMYKSVAKKHEW